MKTNGRLFPVWVLANFRKYKLDKVVIDKDKDPCLRMGKIGLRKYQLFLSAFLSYKSPYRNILIFHGLGSGKTISAINIYNSLYNYTPGWNVFILIKASLRDIPWMRSLNKWLSKDDKEHRMANIRFVHYDAPNADKQFIDIVRASDTSKRPLYIIDEVHNFIRNVYNNVTQGKGRRGKVIYDYISQSVRENSHTRVVCLSGTPVINHPFELGLLFNLLRPGTFPTTESEFNKIYVSESQHTVINQSTKNMFQRRIMGLVSFYAGASPETFASKTVSHLYLTMSRYQTEIYNVFKFQENKIGGSGGLYKAYTRQACNFVFPQISETINGESRPRPSQFRLTEKQGYKVNKESKKVVSNTDTEKYKTKLKEYTSLFVEYLDKLRKLDQQAGYTIHDDIKVITKAVKHNQQEELAILLKEKIDSNRISKELKVMTECGIKLIVACLIQLVTPGISVMFSSIVNVEGIVMCKIYLDRLGFKPYDEKPDYKSYIEYHGGVRYEHRTKMIHVSNRKENFDGKNIKILLIAKAGDEGISLSNVKSEHIIDPYWNKQEEHQRVARAIRHCSHRDLPMNERHVNTFFYNAKLFGTTKRSTDEVISDKAKLKEILTNSFTNAMKEASIDCVLNIEHNKLVSSTRCFSFTEQSLLDTHIGPAFKKDFYEDKQMDNGLNDISSVLVKVKVTKAKYVIRGENKDFSQPKDCWYCAKTGMLYDYELKFPIGRVLMTNDVPEVISNGVFIMGKRIPIPIAT